MDNVRIGNIRFFRKDYLGSGQFGSVFRGTYDKTTVVAVRRIRSFEFLVEHDVLRRAQTHPNITMDYGSDSDVEFEFIATELHVGSLKSLFRGSYSGPPITDLREVLRQITSGLGHLHSRNIIHRNLKPSNILICCGTSGPIMKLSNFGILRQTKPGDSTLWKLAGSKGWLPAETYTQGYFTVAMDLFALGCVFGATLNGGVHPFGEDKDKRIIRIKYSQPMTMTARDILNASGAVGVFQLIKLMVSAVSKLRPTATEVLEHTFFIQSENNTVEYVPLFFSTIGHLTAAKKSKREEEHVKIPCEELTVSLVKKVKLSVEAGNRKAITKSSLLPTGVSGTRDVLRADSTSTLVFDIANNNEESIISTSTPIHSSPMSVIAAAKHSVIPKSPVEKDYSTSVGIPPKTGCTSVIMKKPSLLVDNALKPKDTQDDTVFKRPAAFKSVIVSSHTLNGSLPPGKKSQLSTKLVNAENDLDYVDKDQEIAKSSPVNVAESKVGKELSENSHLKNKKNEESNSVSIAQEERHTDTDMPMDNQEALSLTQCQDEEVLDESIGDLVIDESREEQEEDYGAMEPEMPIVEPEISPDNSSNSSSLLESSSSEEPSFCLQLEDSSSSADTAALTEASSNKEVEQEAPSTKFIVRRFGKTEQEQLFDLCKNQKWNGSKIAEFRRLVMSENVDINALDSEGLAPLLIVCWKQSTEILQLVTILLERPDLQVDVTDGGEWNALVMACRHCQSKNLLGVVSLLLQRHIQVNNKNSEGDNALIVLTANYKQPNLIDIIRLLIQYRIDVNAKNSLGWSALLSLCFNQTKEGLVDLVKVLLDAGIEAGSIDEEGNHALLHVCYNYKRESLIDLVRLFVYKCRIDVRVTNSKGYDALLTVLHYYRGENLLEIMKILIAAGADVNQLTEDGWNSFLCLFSQQYLHKDFIIMTKLLIKNGADINVKDQDSCNSLIFLCSNYKGDRLIEILQLLLDHGVEVNASTKSGWNALVFLSRNHTQNDQFIDATRLLRKYGLHVEAKENDGWNLLHFLCHTPARKNLLKTVRFLLKETDIERAAMDRWGRKPVDYFSSENINPSNKSEVAEIVKLLNKHSK